MSTARNPVFSWGRSPDEYQRMFQLSAPDLNSRILGRGDGPASFNGEMNRLGHKIISVDPAYALTKEQIQGRSEEAQDIIINYCKARPGKFAHHTSVTRMICPGAVCKSCERSCKISTRW